MRRTPRVSKRTSLAAAVAGAFLLLTGAAVTTSSVGATSVEYPRVYEVEQTSNMTCEDIGAWLVDKGVLVTAPDWDAFKVEPPTAGYKDGPLEIELTNVTDYSFDWTSKNSTGVDLVYVKSGEGASKVYLYDPPLEATSGTNLSVPKAISHIDFCWDDGEVTTTTSTTITTTTTEPTTTTTEPTTTTTEGTTTTTVATTTTTLGTTTTTAEVLGTTTTTAEVLGVTQEKLPTTGTAVGGLMVIGGLLLLVGGLVNWTAHRRAEQIAGGTATS